ncbi:MAG: ATP synthase subunit I [Clostridia bacterium]|nr:ATP synthase subunit I [Clostridia bacterium]
MTKNVKTDVLRVAAGNFILGAVMVLIFALAGYFSIEVIWGALLGCSFVSLSFLWLAMSVSKNVEKDPENARKRVSATYTYRLLAMALVVVLAIKLPVFNWVAAIIPLFYQRIVITVVGKMRIKEDSEKEVAEN